MAGWFRAGASGIALAALGISLTGCGGSQDNAAAETAEQFFHAVAHHEGAVACDLLTPATRSELEQSSGTSCAQAIVEELEGPRRDGGEVQVYGVMAQVRWPDGAVFLARMPDGWRVLAAGCTPHADDPYDCVVKGA